MYICLDLDLDLETIRYVFRQDFAANVLSSVNDTELSLLERFHCKQRKYVGFDTDIE